MIGSKTSNRQWEKEFAKKLNSILKKAPAIFSVNWHDHGVTIIHDNSKYFYQIAFDYNKDIKDLIHDIKVHCLKNHYPLIIKTDEVMRELTKEELAEKIASTDNISNVEKMKKETLEEMWRIDRVLLWKDIFIIVNDTKKVAREMKFNGNSAGFLYKFRNGKFDSLQAAGKEFFDNAIYIRDLKYDPGV